MTLSEIIAVIGCIGTILGIAGTIVAYNKGLKKEGAATGTLMSDVGYIKSGVDDLKRKQEKAEERHFELAERVTAVEQSAKQAHRRLDRYDKIITNSQGR